MSNVTMNKALTKRKKNCETLIKGDNLDLLRKMVKETALKIIEEETRLDYQFDLVHVIETMVSQIMKFIRKNITLS